jgi:hypothetical protein
VVGVWSWRKLHALEISKQGNFLSPIWGKKVELADDLFWSTEGMKWSLASRIGAEWYSLGRD